MKLTKMIKKISAFLAIQTYHLTSKRVMTQVLELYDTPNMTKHHHIVSALRYVAIEEYYGKNDFGKGLYIKANHWESEEALQEDLARFEALIKSIETKGYDNKSAIYVDLDGNCINGTHRLALCAWFGIKEIPVIAIRRHLNPKSVEKMKEYFHLSEEEFCLLDEAYQRMRQHLLKK